MSKVEVEQNSSDSHFVVDEDGVVYITTKFRGQKYYLSLSDGILYDTDEILEWNLNPVMTGAVIKITV
jgi:hypothetical protein